jgi:hypothetical protein
VGFKDMDIKKKELKQSPRTGDSTSAGVQTQIILLEGEYVLQLHHRGIHKLRYKNLDHFTLNTLRNCSGIKEVKKTIANIVMIFN